MISPTVRLRRIAALGAWPDRRARRVLAVVGFAALTAAAARLAVPVPFSPVPVTLQTLAVLLAGVLLGPRLGAASQATYLAAGALGLPVFATGAGIAYLAGPTGGYLLAFPLAAWLAGRLAGPAPTGRPTAGHAGRVAFALTAGSALILAGGWAQLAALTGGPEAALRLGVLPFVLGEVVKVATALLVALRVRTRTLGLF